MPEKVTTRLAAMVLALGVLLAAGCSSPSEEQWKTALKADTLSGYRAYIDAFPQGKHTAEARQKAEEKDEELDWMNATVANSADAYHLYLTFDPAGKHAKEAQKKATELLQKDLQAAVCGIDIAQRIIRVVPWDQEAKRWRRDALKEFTWNDETTLSSSGKMLTMKQFVGGARLDKDSTTPAAMRGERAVLTIDGRGVVRKMKMFALFGGEGYTIAAMVGDHGAYPLDPIGEIRGDKVACGSGTP